ncbi:MAG: winged helix-turn-helix domain-containing protein [Deltaproteobacteria bacterium]|nr:MAG: winged helix-turn-helix domain-containing protein [Deltaproteobacteria bacterium]
MLTTEIAEEVTFPFLKEKYNISLGVRQCQRLFHQLGFSLQRPRRTAFEADPFQQEEFKKTSTNG